MKPKIKAFKALTNKTRLKICLILYKKKKNISEIAKILEKSIANTSCQVKILIQAGLVTFEYEEGEHGISKVCTLSVYGIEIIKFHFKQ